MDASFDPYRDWLQLADEPESQTHYRLLGLADLEPDITRILAATERRLKLLEEHTTGEHAAIALQLMAEIREAAAILLDPEQKRAYDTSLLPADGRTQYFYQRRRRQYGPVTSRDLHKMALKGLLRPSDLVQRSGSDRWRPAGEIQNLVFASRRPRHTLSRPPAAPTEEEGFSRVTLVALGTAVFGILFVIGALIWGTVEFGSADALLAQAEQPAEKLEPAREAAILPEAPELLPLLAQPADSQNDLAPTEDEPAAGDEDNSTVASAAEPESNGSPAAAPQPSAQTVANLVARVRPAVVHIRTEKKTGSGFVVDPRGWIVTNLHVVSNCHEAVAELADGRRLPVQGILGADRGVDLAILQVDFGDQPITPLPLAATPPAIGVDVIACGFPTEFGIREGRVESHLFAKQIRDRMILFDKAIRPDSLWLQVSAQIVHGNSGGPIIDHLGTVVGVSTSAGVNLDFPAAVFRFGLSSIEVAKVIQEAGAAVPLTELPRVHEPVVQQAPPLQKAPTAVTVAERLELLKRIHEQRKELLRQRDAVRQRLVAVESQLITTMSRVTELTIKLNNLQNSMALVEQQAAGLEQQSQFEFNPSRRQSLQNSWQRKQSEYLSLSSRYGDLEAQAAGATLELQSRQRQYAEEQRSFELLYAQAAHLRNEWLTIMDAFGKLPKGDHRAAISALTEWTLLDGESAAPYMARGMARFQLGEYGEALNDIQQAATREPGEPAIVATRGWIRARLGDRSGGMADIALTLNMDRQSPYAYYCRAMIRMQERAFRMAEEDLKRALRNSPAFVEAHLDLARLKGTCPAASIRNAKKAIEHATRACELTGYQDWRCLHALALGHAEAKNFPRAIEHIDKAIALAPEDVRELCRRQRTLFEQQRPLIGEAA